MLIIISLKINLVQIWHFGVDFDVIRGVKLWCRRWLIFVRDGSGLGAEGRSSGGSSLAMEFQGVLSPGYLCLRLEFARLGCGFLSLRPQNSWFLGLRSPALTNWYWLPGCRSGHSSQDFGLRRRQSRSCCCWCSRLHSGLCCYWFHAIENRPANLWKTFSEAAQFFVCTSWRNCFAFPPGRGTLRLFHFAEYLSCLLNSTLCVRLTQTASWNSCGCSQVLGPCQNCSHSASDSYSSFHHVLCSQPLECHPLLLPHNQRDSAARSQNWLEFDSETLVSIHQAYLLVNSKASVIRFDSCATGTTSSSCLCFSIMSVLDHYENQGLFSGFPQRDHLVSPCHHQVAGLFSEVWSCDLSPGFGILSCCYWNSSCSLILYLLGSPWESDQYSSHNSSNYLWDHQFSNWSYRWHSWLLILFSSDSIVFIFSFDYLLFQGLVSHRLHFYRLFELSISCHLWFEQEYQKFEQLVEPLPFTISTRAIFCSCSDEEHQIRCQIHASNLRSRPVCMDCFYTCFVVWFLLAPSTDSQMTFLTPVLNFYEFDLLTLPTRIALNFCVEYFYYFYLFLLWNLTHASRRLQLELYILLQQFHICYFGMSLFEPCFWWCCRQRKLRRKDNQLCSRSILWDFDYSSLCQSFIYITEFEDLRLLSSYDQDLWPNFSYFHCIHNQIRFQSYDYFQSSLHHFEFCWS